jgi:hypothetical protein
VRAGDTFYVRDRSVDTHLWVIISDPETDAGRVLMVSLTTYEAYKEDVCLIDVGDHPRITHKSCVAYNEARMTTLAKLTALRDGGYLSVQAPVSDELLARIRAGVSLSTKIKYQYVEFLLDQGVIE